MGGSAPIFVASPRLSEHPWAPGPAPTTRPGGGGGATSRSGGEPPSYPEVAAAGREGDFDIAIFTL